jgi:hypothetical protein
MCSELRKQLTGTASGSGLRRAGDGRCGPPRFGDAIVDGAGAARRIPDCGGVYQDALCYLRKSDRQTLVTMGMKSWPINSGSSESFLAPTRTGKTTRLSSSTLLTTRDAARRPRPYAVTAVWDCSTLSPAAWARAPAQAGRTRIPWPERAKAAVIFLNASDRQGRGEATAKPARRRHSEPADPVARQPGRQHRAHLVLQGVPGPARRTGRPDVPERPPAAGGGRS